MRRYACILSVSFLALVVCAAAFAQKRPQPAAKETQAEIAPLKEDASLEETLAWLNDTLIRYGKFTRYPPTQFQLQEPGHRTRYRFLGLEAQGCSVTYRVRHVSLGGGGGGGGGVQSPNGNFSLAPNGDIVHATKVLKPASGGGSDVVERTVDLTVIDPSLVVGITQKKQDGGAVSFMAAGGKMAVRGVDWYGKPVEYDGDELYVSEKELIEPLVKALRHAVTLCKK